LIVLDAYALVALLADEPAADEVAALVSDGGVIVPAPNLAEAVDRLGRIHGVELARARGALESLEQSADVRVRPVGEADAWRAAALRIAHYHRTTCPLSLGDCMLLAATGDGERLATADRHVLDVARSEGIPWIALPDSTGNRHAPRPIG
jgi:uncharacterized protein with PIN domain